jgi:DNA-binding XRE family transcriptional regulator
MSGVARGIERGNPKYVAGLSGPELCAEVIYEAKGARPSAEASENVDKTPEYWAGWILAYYQWYAARSFSSLSEDGLTIGRVLALYDPLHEAPESKFVEVASRIVGEGTPGRRGRLQRARRAAGYTQKALAEASGVSLRMIQLYEQGKQDINKAQAISVARLARALGCGADDLLG